MYELVIRAVFKCLLGRAMTGPDFQLFNIFESPWSSIDKEQSIKVLELTDDWLSTKASRAS